MTFLYLALVTVAANGIFGFWLGCLWTKRKVRLALKDYGETIDEWMNAPPTISDPMARPEIPPTKAITMAPPSRLTDDEDAIPQKIPTEVSKKIPQ